MRLPALPILDYLVITVATSGIMTAIGRLDEFQRGKDDFDCYMDRMEQYFIANLGFPTSKLKVTITLK